MKSAKEEAKWWGTCIADPSFCFHVRWWLPGFPLQESDGDVQSHGASEDVNVQSSKAANVQSGLSSALVHKTRGNEAFSRGLFAEAVVSYTSCVEACFLVTVQNIDLRDAGSNAEAVKVQADALSNRAAAHIMQVSLLFLLYGQMMGNYRKY